MEKKNLTTSEQFNLAATRAIHELFKALNAEHFKSGYGTVGDRIAAAEKYVARAKALAGSLDLEMGEHALSRKANSDPSLCRSVLPQIPFGREGLEVITNLVIEAAKEANHDYESHAQGPVTGTSIDKMTDELLEVIDRVDSEIDPGTKQDERQLRELRHIVRYFCLCRNQGYYNGKVRRVPNYKAN